MDINSLAHTKWNCKYHIVFAPKYRRKVAYGKMKQDIANILSMLCKRKGVEIVEAEICPDHVHMLVSVYPQQSIPDVVKQIKGATSHKLREEFPQLKKMPSLWTRSYFVSTAGSVSSETIKWYIDTQKTRD